MKTQLISMSIAALAAMPAVPSPVAAQPALPVVHLAVLDVDPAQMRAFKAASSARLASALAADPGVVALHVVVEKDRPERVHVFEMYADADARQRYLGSAHFRHFAASTAGMLTGQASYDTVPLRLGQQSALPAAPLVRLAELAIEPEQLAAYKAAVTEEIDASIDLEPGVIAILAVALKDKPAELRFFEIYADEQAYRQHIASPHFRKYVEATKDMITDRRLFETVPLGLQVKSR